MSVSRIAKVNFLLALSLVAVYVFFNLVTGIEYGKPFLGVGYARLARGSSMKVSPFGLVILVECALAVFLALACFAESGLRGYRRLVGMVGTIGLWSVITSGFAGQSQLANVDTMLGLYVWGSHLLYSILSTKDE